jgi:hypothetical protein
MRAPPFARFGRGGVRAELAHETPGDRRAWQGRVILRRIAAELFAIVADDFTRAFPSRLASFQKRDDQIVRRSRCQGAAPGTASAPTTAGGRQERAAKCS